MHKCLHNTWNVVFIVINLHSPPPSKKHTTQRRQYSLCDVWMCECILKSWEVGFHCVANLRTFLPHICHTSFLVLDCLCKNNYSWNCRQKTLNKFFSINVIILLYSYSRVYYIQKYQSVHLKWKKNLANQDFLLLFGSMWESNLVFFHYKLFWKTLVKHIHSYVD